MQWFTRVTSHASVANGLVLAVGFYAPVLTTGAGRAALLTALLVLLGWINALGIRQSALVVNMYVGTVPARVKIHLGGDEGRVGERAVSAGSRPGGPRGTGTPNAAPRSGRETGHP
jgi:hypothetical protein